MSVKLFFNILRPGTLCITSKRRRMATSDAPCRRLVLRLTHIVRDQQSRFWTTRTDQITSGILGQGKMTKLLNIRRRTHSKILSRSLTSSPLLYLSLYRLRARSTHSRVVNLFLRTPGIRAIMMPGLHLYLPPSRNTLIILS